MPTKKNDRAKLVLNLIVFLIQFYRLYHILNKIIQKMDHRVPHLIFQLFQRPCLYHVTKSLHIESTVGDIRSRQDIFVE